MVNSSSSGKIISLWLDTFQTALLIPTNGKFLVKSNSNMMKETQEFQTFLNLQGNDQKWSFCCDCEYFLLQHMAVPLCLCVAQLTDFVQSQVKERGGDCIPVICDSTNEKEIEDLFGRIAREQKGRLDILVNNAYAGVNVSSTQLSWKMILLTDSYHNWNYFLRRFSRTWAKSSGKLIQPYGTPSTTQASGAYVCLHKLFAHNAICTSPGILHRTLCNWFSVRCFSVLR